MSYDIYQQQLQNQPLSMDFCVNICKVQICYCAINTQYGIPFLEFKLLKNNANVLTFSSFDAKINKQTDIKTHVLQNKPDINGDDILGYIIFKDEIYCFIKFTDNQSSALYSNRESDAIVIPSDIINSRHYFNIPIDDVVYRFFIKNQHCLYLKTSESKQLLTPKSYYYGDTIAKQHYLLNHGIPKQSYLGIFGSYYYVSSFNDAIINAGWTTSSDAQIINNIPITTGKYGKFTQGAIYRCILFIEHVECKLSGQSDNSSTTKMLINRSYDFAIKNQHISDRQSSWSEYYDTIYSGIGADMQFNMIAHKYPIFITKYVELDMMSLPMKKTDIYKSILIK